ncbi:MAG: thiamine-phosphate kinase [Microcystaceae cyanobacterium]
MNQKELIENPNLTVKDLGEQQLLPILQAFCPSDIIGDDAAILNVPDEQQLIVTTDVLVDKVHFSQQTTEAEAVGWRSVAANLSDIAAMGGYPLGITVGLSLTPDMTLVWLKKLYQGMADCLQTYQTVMLGGDICRSSEVTVAITALGRVFPHQVIRRSTANIGDVILITGEHGLSRGGLELLLSTDRTVNLDKTAKNKLIKAHKYPRPRLDIIQQIHQQEMSFSLAGMDSSDGLADAIIQICRSSGVGATIELESLPLAPELVQWVGVKTALDWTFYGGEDFELVLCLGEKEAKLLIDKLGKNVAMIGQITADKMVKLTSKNPDFPPRILTLEEGFQHFKA